MFGAIVIAEKEDLESWSLNIDLSSICWCGLAILPEFGHFQGGLGGIGGFKLLQTAEPNLCQLLMASLNLLHKTDQNSWKVHQGPQKKFLLVKSPIW